MSAKSGDFGDISDNSRSNSPIHSIKLDELIIEDSNSSTFSTTMNIPKASKSCARKSSSKSMLSKSTNKKKKYSIEHEMKMIYAPEDLTSNFMADFDPTKSRRDKTRNKKKVDYSEANQAKKQTNLYNERGEHRKSGKDFCDCLVKSCNGCHFPCPKCKSMKCGFECRQNRKWQIEFITNEDNSMEKRINEYAVQTTKK